MSTIQSNEDSGSHDYMYQFLDNFVVAYGQLLQRTASLEVSPEPSHRKIAETFEKTVLTTITSTQDTLGEAWTRQSEQKNGQSAFETRTVPTPKPRGKTNIALPGLLLMLSSASDACPLFLCRLASLQGKDPEEDSLIGRAVESSVIALSDSSPSLVNAAVRFLSSVVCNM